MPFPSTPYVTASHTAVGPLTDPSPYVDLSLLGVEFWALVDTSDGTKGRVFKEDETELAVVWLSFDNDAETGGLRFKWSGTWSAAGANTVRIYPPLAARASVGAGDTFGSFNAFDDDWKMYLPLDEAVNNLPDGYKDETQHGNDGQGVSMALPAVAGQVGDAQDFDGAADYIDCGGVVHDADNDNITVSAWATTEDLAAIGTIAGYRGNPIGNTTGWAFRFRGDLAGDPIEFSLFGIADVTSDASGIVADELVRLAVTYDKSNVIFYKNGVQLSSHAQSSSIFPSTRNLLVGANNSQGTAALFWRGLLDEVQVHSTARSADWDAEDFAATKNPGTYWGVWEFVSAGTTHNVTATSAASFSTVANAAVKTFVTAISAASFSTVANAAVKTFVTAISAASFSTVANASFVNEAADVFIEVAVTLTQEQDLEMTIVQEQELMVTI